MIINIIYFAAAVSTVFFAYKVLKAYAKGKKTSDIKSLLYSLFVSVVIIWVINIYTGYIQ